MRFDQAPGTPLDVAALVAALHALAPAAGASTVFALDGRSGSGKTTLAGRLAALAGCPVIRMEDLYTGWDGLRAGSQRLAREVLVPLAQSRAAGYRRWDWASGTLGEHVPVPAGGLLLVEGVGSGARVCRPYLSALVWLHAPTPVRRQRALARDGETYRPHWQRWAEQEDSYLAADRPHRTVDLVLGSVPDPPVVLGRPATGGGWDGFSP